MTRACSLFVIFLGAISSILASERDALDIEANIQARHFPYSGILDPVYGSATTDDIAGYTHCGDSALWTGHYLAAESFRYKVTQSADAFANIQKAIDALKALVDVTGNNLLARCIVPVDSPFAAGIEMEESHNGIYFNGPWFWVGNTSRDQYAGAVFGLTVAFDMVDDADTRGAIIDLLTRIIEYPRGHDWVLPEPDGSKNLDFIPRPDYINTFLEVGRHVNPQRFNGDTLEEKILLAVNVATPIQVDTGDDNSYFKFNLDSINLYNLVRLDPNQVRTDSRNAYNVLRQHTALHQNAFFDIIDRGLNGPDAGRDAETIALLDQWLQRPRRDAFVDVSSQVAVCGTQACTPVPVPTRPPTDFLWQRSPFQLSGGLYGIIETAGIDYILPYWMARYYGVESPLTVSSAASPSAPLAPGSLGTITGSNLASDTVCAQPPLPTSLGGATVTVADAAGNQFTATLLCASPGQITFVLPGGVAPGVATFTVTNGDTVLTGPANVQPVAPALFSMNGKGSGVAAATAFREQAASTNLTSPVQVFQCSDAGCVATPINLGVDTPVFVTFCATGIRNLSSLSNVSLTIGSVSVPVSYAGPQPGWDGLDRVDVPLTLNLRGSGEVPVVVTVDGVSSNAVTINIQ